MPIPAAIIGALGASVRGWNLAYVDTFDTDPSAKYSTRQGFPSVSWDSANQALSVLGNTSQNFVAYDAWGGFTGRFAFEMDVLFVSDSAARKHWGFFCDSSTSGTQGYRAANIDSVITFSRWSGSSETSIGTFTEASNFVVGNTYTLRLERDANGNFTFYVNGVAQPTVLNNTFYTTIRPGFFVYGCEIRINELRVYN